MPCKGKSFPGRGFSCGEYNTEKTGLGKLLGKCLKGVRVTDNAHLKKRNAGLPTMAG